MKNSTAQNSLKLLVVLLIGIAVFLSGVFVGKIQVKNGSAEALTYNLTGDFQGKSQDVDVDLLWEVWGQLEKTYIKKNISGNDLLEGAARGLVQSLNDPYTFYLSKEETQDYLEGNAGAFEGIGVTLKQKGDYVSIESAIEGYPARKAGLEPDDVILKVDGEDMKGKTTVYVASKVRGKSGTEVSLDIFKSKAQEEKNYKIIREKIDLDNISYEKLEDGIVKISIIKFTEENVAKFNSQWDAVVADALATNPKGIIIDLRNNPGGFVDAAKYSSSEFLDKGKTILMEEDRNGYRESFKVERTGLLKNIPVVILVNEGTASASEIFAGALQDNGRAQVIGKKTVGKGVEQRIIDLSNGASMHVVFRKWLTPAGRNISPDSPITPNFEVDLTNEDYDNGKDPQQDKAIELLKEKF
jgi:carboxyl-terminal processing protease